MGRKRAVAPVHIGHGVVLIWRAGLRMGGPGWLIPSDFGRPVTRDDRGKHGKFVTEGENPLAVITAFETVITQGDRNGEVWCLDMVLI